MIEDERNIVGFRSETSDSGGITKYWVKDGNYRI